ncbi:MAG: DUF4062 domain-containing protein, partial [Endomicrobiaceae bacterium]|nr:DUF4062 domain-containing protein [Endomicrobiaceae bacterium]
MHDRGAVTYTQETSLEQSCYDELTTCDIVVCIIGNKYGTQSSSGNYSITMQELLEAEKQKKKLYIFIVNDVYIENNIYIANKDTKDLKFNYADNIEIHKFIAEIREKIRNHPILAFDNVADVINMLKSQFAGLFQRLLTQEATLTEHKTYYDIVDMVKKMQESISLFAEEKESFFTKFQSSIFTSLPTINVIKRNMNMKYSSFYAPNKISLDEILNLFGFIKPEDIAATEEEYTYHKYNETNIEILTLKSKLFDKSGNLEDIRDKKLLDEYIKYYIKEYPKQEDTMDEEIPF